MTFDVIACESEREAESRREDIRSGVLPVLLLQASPDLTHQIYTIWVLYSVVVPF